MPPRRLRAIADPVTLHVDGDRVLAGRGEPVAVALAAAGRVVLGRSVKYHRPRGANCYAGRCDGCLMRVGGVPSVMTCQLPAEDGLVIETQNVVGTARRDLLAATDWFFPDGMNHHEMFTWNEQVNNVMKKIARRVAGVGEVPSEALAPRPTEDLEADVLVIGAGAAGLIVAAEVAGRGFDVLVLEESPSPGGTLAEWPLPLDGRLASALADGLAEAAVAAGAELRVRVAAVGAYDPWEDAGGMTPHHEEPLLPGERLVRDSVPPPPAESPVRRRARPPAVIADGPGGLLRVRPRRTVVAMGRHEGGVAFMGNDRPGVIGLRGALRLLSHGVLPGERVLLVGEGPLLSGLGEALREAGAETLGPYDEVALEEALGRPEVTGARVAGQAVSCDAIVVGAVTSSAYELGAQLGVGVEWTGTAYDLVAADEDGATDAPDVRVVGSASGVVELDALESQARAAGAAIADGLAADRFAADQLAAKDLVADDRGGRPRG